MSNATLVDVSSVLVVDDHLVFAQLLADRLRRDVGIDRAEVASTVEQARSAVGEQRPDVVLLDPDLEGGSGLGLIADLRSLEDGPGVVVLADAAHASLSAFGLDPEVCAWISKESPFEDLLLAIDAVRRGDLPHPVPHEVDVVPATDPEQDLPTLRDARRGGVDGALTLTPRQAEVLDCLLAGMTRAEVAVRLGLSPHTVRDHVRHLFRIAEVTSTTELVARARAGEESEPRRLRLVPGP